MDPRLHRLINTAFRQNSLVGLYIDLQDNNGKTASLDKVFDNAATLANGFTQRGIPNKWAIWPLKSKIDKSVLSRSYQDLELAPSDDFRTVSPAPTDTVYMKYSSGLQENRKFISDYETTEDPVFVLSGVHADQCISTSIMGILDRFYSAQIIIAHNAVNINSTPKSYLNALQRDC